MGQGDHLKALLLRTGIQPDQEPELVGDKVVDRLGAGPIAEEMGRGHPAGRTDGRHHLQIRIFFHMHRLAGKLFDFSDQLLGGGIEGH